MSKTFLRLLSLVLALCLSVSSALAEFSWLDGELAPLLGDNRETSFSLGFRINSLLPFGQETLDMLNQTLEHIRVSSRICDEDTHLAVCVDGQSLFTLSEAPQGDWLALRTDLLPNRVLVAEQSPMDVLSGNEAAQKPLFDLHAAINQAEELWQPLSEAIVPYATEKEANYKISGIGYARWVRLARLTPEQSGSLQAQIAGMLACGMDDAFCAQLAQLSCGDGFTVALYSDSEGGTPLAIYMKGSVTLNEAKYSLAYQWAFAEEEGQRSDTYRFELEMSKSPKHKRLVEAERTVAQTDTGLTLTRECRLTVKDDARNQVVTDKDNLKAIRKDNRVELTGSLENTLKDLSGKEAVTTTTSILPALAFTDAQGAAALTGTVSLEEKQGKKTLRSLAFLFDEGPAHALEAAEAEGSLFAVGGSDPLDPAVAGSSLAQNTDVIWSEPATDAYLVGKPPLGITAYTVPDVLTTVDLDTVQAEEKTALLNEMAQNAAGALLAALARLPGEPLTLLTDNMTPEDYQAFLSLLGE